jgi:hypothetical protein
MYRDEMNIPVAYRSRDELALLPHGCTLVEQGIVPVPLLLPDPDDPFDSDPRKSLMYGLIART